MTATSSSLSFGFAADETLTTTSSDGPDVSITDSEGLSISINIGSVATGDAESGVGALAQGSATAVGTDTFAAGELVATAELGVAYDSAHAEASFAAVGIDYGEGLAFATVGAYAEVTGSFDIFISTSSYQSTVATVGTTSLWLEEQSTSVTGIDIGGSLSADSDIASSDASFEPFDESWTTEPEIFDGADFISEDATFEVELLETQLDLDISGNVALVDFVAEASGPNTFADATISVLAVEDQLSTVDGIVTAWATP